VFSELGFLCRRGITCSQFESQTATKARFGCYSKLTHKGVPLYADAAPEDIWTCPHIRNTVRRQIESKNRSRRRTRVAKATKTTRGRRFQYLTKTDQRNSKSDHAKGESKRIQDKYTAGRKPKYWDIVSNLQYGSVASIRRDMRSDEEDKISDARKQ
jgi:hypothetical protein